MESLASAKEGSEPAQVLVFTRTLGTIPGLAVLAPLTSCVSELRADAELAPGNIVNSPFRQFCLKEKTQKEEKGGNRDPVHPAQRQDSEEREGGMMKSR